MGWFGKGIMDGDSPMDWLAVFMQIIGAPEDARYDKPDPKIRTSIETWQHALAERVRRERDKQDRNIGWQVLGVFIMAQGAKILNDVRGAITVALSEDEWAKRDLERKIYVADMKDIIDAYDGHTPTREYKDWSKEYDLSEDDMQNPPTSWRMLNVAMCFVAEHLKNKKWFKGVQFVVNSAGYRMILLVDEKDVDDGKGELLRDADVPGELFGIPVSFYPNSQVTVMKKGYKINIE